MMRMTVADMTNSWAYYSSCFLMTLATQHTEARPLFITETDLSREDVKSMVHHILKSSELFNSLVEDEDKSPSNNNNNNNSNNNKNSGAEKGAIVGGTIAAGIILGVIVFIGILIYKQYRIRRQRADGQVGDTKSSPSKGSRPETTSDSSAYRSWRHIFNRRVSIPDSLSIYSRQSYGNPPVTTQVEIVPTQSIPPPTIPQKAAQMLGVEGVHGLGSTTPLIISPLPSPRLPNSPMAKHFIVWNPLTQNPPQQHPSPQGPSTQGPLIPTTGSVARNNSNSLSDSRARARTSSNCTMSTLGRELLYDTMKPLPPIKFSPPSEMKALPHPPSSVSKATKPSPVSTNSMNGQKRALSRRYFVPLFKKNGQLPSPISPDVTLATESGIQEEGDANTKAETVLRDSSRAGLFSLGENKI